MTMDADITKVFICKDCSKEFSLTSGEVEFYTTHKSDSGNPMVLPKRCSACRRKKRDLKGGQYHQVGGEHQEGFNK